MFLKMLTPLIPRGVFIGLDRGKSSLKAVIARITPTGVELEDFFIQDILSIGEAQKSSFLKDKFINFLKERDISQGEVFVNLEDDATFCSRISMPYMPASELKQALSWEAKDILPFSAQDAVIDFQIFKEKENPDGTKSLDLIIMAVHKKAIDETLAFFKDTDFTVKNISIVPASLGNLIDSAKNLEMGPAEPLAFLELGYGHTNISIFKENKLIFTRRLLMGSDDITRSLAATISTEKGLISLSYPEAEKIKVEYGIPQEDYPMEVFGYNLQSGRIFSMMRPVLEKIAHEARNSFVYLAEKFGEPNIKKIYLTGGGARLKNIDKFFKDQLNIDTEIFPLQDAISIGKNIPEEQKNSFAHIVPVSGAISGKEEKVNFLPENLRITGLKQTKQFLFKISAWVIFSIFSLVFLFTGIRHAIYKKRSAYFKRQADLIARLNVIKADIDNMQSIVSSIKANKLDTVSILEEISKRTPKNILLDRIDFTLSRQDLRLSGLIFASEEEAGRILSDYIKTMEDSAVFETANLVSSAVGKTEEQPALVFTISAKLQGR
jgi:type IV pilus assembly protein PilM